jgi:hypothetical protein
VLEQLRDPLMANEWSAFSHDLTAQRHPGVAVQGPPGTGRDAAGQVDRATADARIVELTTSPRRATS